ncbi:ribonuclease III family protein [Candidatus Harpocratesius sp.]
MDEIISQQFKKNLVSWLKSFNLHNIVLPMIITAFTHPSYKSIEPYAEDYERFEFLGDSVLDLVTAEELIRESNAKEGVLTELRKQIVNNEYLANVFDQLKIQQFIRTAAKYSPSIKDKANILEAFFGAIFLNFGYRKCVDVWEMIQAKMGKRPKRVPKPPLSPEDVENKAQNQVFYKSLGLTPKNAKSMLQELCQKQSLEIPKYTLIEQSGPEHNPLFRVKVSAILFAGPPQWVRMAIGEGSNKKTAEINAAERLCDQIFLEYIPMS